MKERLENMLNSLDGKSAEEVLEIFNEFMRNLSSEDAKELDTILEEEIREIGNKFGFPETISIDTIVSYGNIDITNEPKEIMENMLEDAIANERYELAAELRDSINKYEKNDTKI